MKKTAFIITGILTATLIVIILLTKNHSDQTTSEDTIEIKQMVHAYSSGEVEGESASITATELIVTNQAGEKILPFT